MRYATIDNVSIEMFRYWLERDWPRVEKLNDFTLRDDTPADADPRFEGRWHPSLEAAPMGTIAAETTQTGTATVGYSQWGVVHTRNAPFGEPATEKRTLEWLPTFGLWLLWRFPQVAFLDDAAPAKDDERNEDVAIDVTEPRREPAKFWKEVQKQAKASGSVTTYLAEREIPKSTYYDNLSRYELSGGVRKPGQNPDSEPDTSLL